MDAETERKPESKEELLKWIRESWDGLMSTVEGLDPAALTRPGPEGWSPRDHLAHLTLWERVALYRYLRNASFAEATGLSEEEAAPVKKLPVEGGINEFFYERQKGRRLEEILAELQAVHRDLVAEIEGRPWADLTAPVRPGKPETMLDHLIWNTYEHYREHQQFILSMQAG